MDVIGAAFEKVRGFTWVNPPLAPIERYLETGAPADRENIRPPGSGNFWVSYLSEAIARPDVWGVRDRRLVHALVKMGSYEPLGNWLCAAVRDEKAGVDLTTLVAQELKEAGLSDGDVLAFLLARDYIFASGREGDLNSAARSVLSADDSRLEAALRARGAWREASFGLEMAGFVDLMLTHAPDRMPRLAPAVLIRTNREMSPDVLRLLVTRGGRQYETEVFRFFDEAKDGWVRYRLGCALFEADRERYGKRSWDAALEALKMGAGSANHGPIAAWLVANFGAKAVPELVTYLKRSEAAHWSQQVVQAVSGLGEAGLPVLMAGLAHEDTRPRFAALAQLVAMGGETHDAVIEQAIRRGLEGEPGAIIQCLAIAARWRPARIEDALWKLMEHSSKPVREAAARALARAGEPVVARAVELLAHRKADVRGAGVILLATVGSATAMAALDARADQETNDDVRDQILVAVEEVRRRDGRPVDRAAVLARVARVENKLSKPVAEWLDEEKLPTLHWQGGEPLDRRTVRWLLYRQSRARAMLADVEARPLLALIDRGAAAGFARAVLDAFLAAGARSEDRWGMALAGLLGDDGLVPVLAARVREWVDANRGKLAEYAVQALALLGSDAALLSVDAMSIRYRTKMKNVGRAAAEAFAAAAEARSIEPDELGDRVVPWLGFEPGQPRVVDAGKTRVEVMVGLDLKLAFKDAATGKRIASFPKSAPAAAVTEIKETAATLKEVAKGQMLRMEGVFTRQRRWPVAVWRKLFLGHPLLRPFAVRLVWGLWNRGAGVAPTATFRALEDLSLTTADEESFTLPDSGEVDVSVVHPLELSAEGLQSWRRHLADHEVEAPFPQMERDIVRARPEDAAVGFYRAVEGTHLNAMTFKGRAERLGWHRGSVCDGGSITAYVKSFPAGHVDVILGLEGFFIGAGMDDQVTLGTACFVRSSAVQFGSYLYDEPSKEDDPRVVPLGQVPAIPFSETLADLRRIAETSAG
jgi:hypothetical protein